MQNRGRENDARPPMKCIIQFILVACLLLTGCSDSEHKHLLVFSFSNAKAVSQAKLDFGKAVAEIIDPKVLRAFDECVTSSTPTKATKQPVPMANGNWIVICRGNRESKGVALHIFADGQVSWRYENALVINGALQITGDATNQVQSTLLARLVADRLRQTIPDVVKPYDLLNSGDPFAKK